MKLPGARGLSPEPSRLGYELAGRMMRQSEQLHRVRILSETGQPTALGHERSAIEQLALLLLGEVF